MGTVAGAGDAMNAVRAELGLWVGRIETILIGRGVLDAYGQIATGLGPSLPPDIEEALDGFFEYPIELVGLLKISRDARDGRPLSPAVLMAAHLMAREVLEALQGQTSDRGALLRDLTSYCHRNDPNHGANRSDYGHTNRNVVRFIVHAVLR